MSIGDGVSTTTVYSATVLNMKWALIAYLQLPTGSYQIDGYVSFANNGYEQVTTARLFADATLTTGAVGDQVGGNAQVTVFNGDQGEGEATLPVGGLVTLTASSFIMLELAPNAYGSSLPPDGTPATSVEGVYLSAVTLGSVA